MESDSALFTDDFKFKKIYDENEFNAVIKFTSENKNCLLRPFEFSGRNEYRIKQGIQNMKEFNRLMDSLFSNGAMPHASLRNMERFNQLSDSLSKISNESLQIINSTTTDNLVMERQFYQYVKMKELTDAQPEMAVTTVKINEYEAITLREQFARYCFFEEWRNRIMTQNILKTIKAHPGKTIVVLTGFYHRAHVGYELQFQQQAYNFTLTQPFLN
jgi:hypothetical protein